MTADEIIDKQMQGKILTYTTVFSPPEGFTAPLRLALVEIEGEKPILCSSEILEMQIGMRVKVQITDGKAVCRKADG